MDNIHRTTANGPILAVSSGIVLEQMVCGYPVWNGTFAGCRDELVRRALVGEGGWVMTLNLEMISLAERDPSYHELSHSANIFLADGMPVVWAARKKYPAARMPGRIAGSDLIGELIAKIPPSQIAVIGGVDPAVGLRKVLGEAASQAYVFNGRVNPEEAEMEQFLAEFEKRDARMVFVALGVPKQDKVARMLRDRYPKAIFIGVGGSFELLSGHKKRAPRWMQRIGLEWAFRLLMEPRRLGHRYLVQYWSGVAAIRRDLRATRQANR